MEPITTTVGHTVSYVIQYLDANQNPMLVTPTPDAPPTWSDAPAPAGAATLVADPTGLTAVDTCNAAGSDTVTCSLTVGGVAYSASSTIGISAAPQVLTSIELIATVSA